MQNMYDGTEYRLRPCKTFAEITVCIQQDSMQRNVVIIEPSQLTNPLFDELQRLLTASSKHYAFILTMPNYDAGLIQNALQKGVFFFLVEPYSADVIRTNIESALNTELSLVARLNQLDSSKKLPLLIDQACFQVQTPDEAQTIAAILGYISPNPSKVSLGLFELMLNGIEHGNLGLGYHKKAELLAKGSLQEETRQRLKQPENTNKYVHISVKRKPTRLVFTIKDEGSGFNYQDFLEFDQQRTLAKNGRGIMIANRYSFDELTFENGGSTVIAQVFLNPQSATVT